jgi:hypothetical protein
MRKLKHQANSQEGILKIWQKSNQTSWKKKSIFRVYANFDSDSKEIESDSKISNKNRDDELKQLFKSCCGLKKSENPEEILSKALELLKRNDEALILPAINILGKIFNEKVNLEETFKVLQATWKKYRWSQMAILKLLTKLSPIQSSTFLHSSLFPEILKFTSTEVIDYRSTCCIFLTTLLKLSLSPKWLSKKLPRCLHPLINLSN